ncbi:hypothetical protein CHISP_0740 [Chitinispirillum alkaliphilum]|nr:hypothetical protein CHISP_0740 [Chitinispirillum alkaliphilum]
MTEIIKVKKHLDYLWVSFPDILNLEHHGAIENQITSYINDEEKRIVLDFSKTGVLYSSGLGLLIRLRRLVHEAGGCLYLVNVRKEVINLLSTMNLDKVFQIFSTDVEFELSQDDILDRYLNHHDLEFLFTSQIESGICRIIFGGRMITGRDFTSCKAFAPRLGVSDYVFDLRGLELIDSQGVEILISLANKIKASRGESRVFGASELVRELIEAFDRDGLFVFCKSEKDALV